MLSARLAAEVPFCMGLCNVVKGAPIRSNIIYEKYMNHVISVIRFKFFLKVWRTLGSPAWPKAQNARDRETNFNRFTKGI